MRGRKITKWIWLFVFIVAGKYARADFYRAADTINRNIVSLYGNGYQYPHTTDEKQELIKANGLSGWKDTAVSIRVFFYPGHSGYVSLSIKMKSPTGDSKIKLRLDGGGKVYELPIIITKDFLEIPVGDFEIAGSSYHFIEIKAVSKTGEFFPDIESVIISGPAAKNLACNTSDYRAAPSVHLRYQVQADTAIAWFYTEVSVPEGVNAINAYYETNGFSDGYMGIQINSPTERRVIFSIWSNYKTDNPEEIPKEYEVKLLKKGDAVFSDQFGNEGSGGHSHLELMWKNGQTYKLLVGAKPAGDHTIYTGYYFDAEKREWKLIAQWDKAKTGGKTLSGLYAFVENFGENGDDYFKAYYGNQWVYTASGNWKEVTTCTFTMTASPFKHPRYDYGAGVEDNRFYLFSGGFKQINNLAPHSVIDRRPNGKAPDIDFSKLPDH